MTDSHALVQSTTTYTAKKAFFSFLGNTFRMYDASGGLAFYIKQKAFKLKEDIRIFTGEDMQTELLTIQARQVIDFAAAYDIVDAQSGVKVGAARRKGFKSILRDSWQLLDVDDNPIAQLQEDSTALALVRRFLSNLIPQRFHIACEGGGSVEVRQHFNPFVYRLQVSIPRQVTLDRRLIMGVVSLIAAIEGRQN